MEGTPVYVHIGVVECLVGQVKTQTGWEIIDQSDMYAQMVFIAVCKKVGVGFVHHPVFRSSHCENWER